MPILTYEKFEERAMELEKGDTEANGEMSLLGGKTYRELVEQLDDILYMTDRRGFITFVNPRIREASGYEPQELIGRPMTDFVHPDDRKRMAMHLGKILSNDVQPSEYRFIRKSGELRWVRGRGRAIVRDGHVIGVAGVLVDITEAKDLRDRLEERRRLDAISLLAGGIAHRFNNSLSIIIGNIDLLEMDGLENGGQMESLKEMKQSAQLMAPEWTKR